MGEHMAHLSKRAAHRFGIDRTIEEIIGKYLVGMPQQVGRTAYVHIDDEEQLGRRHQQQGQHQALEIAVGDPCAAQVQQDCDRKVEAEHAPFERHLERGQPLAQYIHRRNRLGRGQKPVGKGPQHQQNHSPAIAAGRVTRGRRFRKQHIGQQPHPGGQTAAQPEQDRFVGRIGTDQVRHARIGQEMQDIEQRHRQKRAAQHHGTDRAHGFLRAVASEENQRRHDDGEDFHQRMGCQESRGRERQLIGRNGLPQQQRNACGQQQYAGEAVCLLSWRSHQKRMSLRGWRTDRSHIFDKGIIFSWPGSTVCGIESVCFGGSRKQTRTFVNRPQGSRKIKAAPPSDYDMVTGA